MDEETWQRYLARIAQKNQTVTARPQITVHTPGPGGRDWGNIDPTTGRPKIAAHTVGGRAGRVDGGPGWVGTANRGPGGGTDTRQILAMAKKLQRENPELVEQVRQNVDPSTLAGQLEDMGIRPQEVIGQFQPYKRPLPPGQGDWTGGTDPDPIPPGMIGPPEYYGPPPGMIGPPEYQLGRPDRYMPYPRWRRPPEDEYMGYLSKQEGWNPEWTQYSDQLARYLRDPSVDVTEDYVVTSGKPGVKDANLKKGIPQDVWSDIAKWYEGKMNAPESGDPYPGKFKNWDKFKGDYFQRPRPYPYPPRPSGPRPLPEGWRRGPGGDTDYQKINPETGEWETHFFAGWGSPWTDSKGRPLPGIPEWNPPGRPTPPGPPISPNWEKLRRAGQYLDYAKGQEGWNSEWDPYRGILMQYLGGVRDDVTNPLPHPNWGEWGATDPNTPTHIPQELWAQMGEFGKGLKPMSGDEWGYKEENIRPAPPPYYEPIPQPMPNPPQMMF